MSRGTWNRIKLSKFFYAQIYRRLITVIVASQAFNITLCLAIIYLYFHTPLPDFYATNGVTQPIQLAAMDERNYSAEALLPPDPINEVENKVIPE